MKNDSFQLNLHNGDYDGDARRITAAEAKYMRRTAGYTRTDYKTNTQIAKE
jgi:hypothetical protein